MFDSNTGNNQSIFGSSLSNGLASAAIQNQSALATNQYGLTQAIFPYNPTTCTNSWITPFPSPPPLTPDTAKDLIAQLEHDKVLVADHKLLFGQYMGKSLRNIPLEYIVQLGAAMRGARIQVAKELRRRRALERLTAKP